MGEILEIFFENNKLSINIYSLFFKVNLIIKIKLYFKSPKVFFQEHYMQQMGRRYSIDLSMDTIIFSGNLIYFDTFIMILISLYVRVMNVSLN